MTQPPQPDERETTVADADVPDENDDDWSPYAVHGAVFGTAIGIPVFLFGFLAFKAPEAVVLWGSILGTITTAMVGGYLAAKFR